MGPALSTARRRLQALEYDYEMFATEAGRNVFAAADLDGDGRIDMAGFSKIVHVRPHPYTLTALPQKHKMTHDIHNAMPATRHARACMPSPQPAPRTEHLDNLVAVRTYRHLNCSSRTP